LEIERDPSFGKTILFGQVSQLFHSLDHALIALRNVQSEVYSGLLFSGPVQFAEADVISIELHGPLKLVSGLTKLPQGVRRAFVGFCKLLPFWEAEQSRRHADAELHWQNVRAKELENFESSEASGTSGFRRCRTFWGAFQGQSR
jgi:hypothetical protein